MMSNKKNKKNMSETFKPSCGFCGAEVDEISQRTEQKVSAIYDCKKCHNTYCDQCSYSNEDTSEKQLCLRCDSVLKKVS